jgi:predicted transcriptional regulator
VTPPSDQRPHDPGTGIRMDARLDSTTRAKVDDLAMRFHQPRAAVLCHIMEWGLGRRHIGPLDQGESQGPVRHLYLYVASDLRERAEKAATAAGVTKAPCLRHMVRRITIEDFPSSWQKARSEKRSHDSHTYGTGFMLRLDDQTREKLEELSTHFDTSAAEVIRQLVAQAEPEDFPPSWRMRVAERRPR